MYVIIPREQWKRAYHQYEQTDDYGEMFIGHSLRPDGTPDGGWLNFGKDGKVYGPPDPNWDLVSPVGRILNE